MKRSILLALVAALVLAVGFSPSAGAVAESGAQASAKKGAKCKAKKAKGKAKGSATASAKKGKACKGKKGSAGGAWPPSDGLYGDPADGVYLTIDDNGKAAQLGYEASRTTCAPFIYSSEDVPLSTSSGGLRASDSGTILVAGIPVFVSWSITVEKPTLAYSLKFHVKVDEIGCDDKVVVGGVLGKAP